MSAFPFFPRLHRLYCARPNSTPPAITTGVGPEGRSVVYLQPPHGFKNDTKDSADTEVPSSMPQNSVFAPSQSSMHSSSPSPLHSRNLNLIANIATTLPPLSPFNSPSFSADSSSDSFSSSQTPFSPSNPNLGPTFSHFNASQSISPPSSQPLSQSTQSGDLTDARTCISTAVASARSRLGSNQPKRQTVEDSFAEYTKYVLLYYSWIYIL